MKTLSVDCGVLALAGPPEVSLQLEAVFQLPPEVRRQYLSARATDPVSVAAAQCRCGRYDPIRPRPSVHFRLPHVQPPVRR